MFVRMYACVCLSAYIYGNFILANVEAKDVKIGDALYIIGLYSWWETSKRVVVTWKVGEKLEFHFAEVSGSTHQVRFLWHAYFMN